MRRAAAMLAAALALGVSGVGAYQLAPVQQRKEWREIAWPFPRDGWPTGRAFRCDGRECSGAELYVRAKRGFCNCERGVADDDEVDRVTDLDLIAPRFAPSAPGAEIRIAGLQGRARHYDLELAGGVGRAATGIALSRRCDLLVAVVQGGSDAMATQGAALQLLETNELRHWIVAALDGR
jgi:hypothetical protein